MDRKFKVGDRVEFVRSDAPFYEGCTGEIVWIGTGDCPYPYMVKGEVCGHVRNCAVAEASLRLLESSADTDKPNHLYNVGDTVLIKSRQWYDANKDEYGSVPSPSGGNNFVNGMVQYCGQIMKIASVPRAREYYMENSNYFFSDFMIERKVESDESLSCPFNPGDKVRAKSKEWLDKQPKTANGYPRVGNLTIYDKMKRICGQECTVIRATQDGHLEIIGSPFIFPVEMFEPCGLTPQTADILISRLNPFARDFSCQTPPIIDLSLIQNNKLLTDIQLD